jgi:hypothetical protein
MLQIGSAVRSEPAHTSTHQTALASDSSRQTEVLHNQIALGPQAFSEQDERHSKAIAAAGIGRSADSGDESVTALEHA